MISKTNGVVDTDRATEARRAAVFRDMAPGRKLELVEDANRTARELALAGITARCPTATEGQRERMLLGLILGEPLATDLYGPPPALADDSA